MKEQLSNAKQEKYELQEEIMLYEQQLNSLQK